MYLSFFQSIRDVIQSFFEKTTVNPFVLVILGIVIGFSLAIILYVIIVTGVFKKGSRKALNKNIDIDDEEIKKLVNNARNRFNLESSMLPTVEKFRNLGEISKGLLNDIASSFYPDSKHPIFELSVNEVFELNHYITDRVDSMFDHVLLRKVKNAKISQVLNIIDLKKKMDENKAIKAVKKVSPITKYVTTVLRAVNPISWVKKLIVNSTLTVASNKISLTIIDIVAEETVKVYSKNVFNEEKDFNLQVEKEIYELETMIDNNN